MAKVNYNINQFAEMLTSSSDVTRVAFQGDLTKILAGAEYKGLRGKALFEELDGVAGRYGERLHGEGIGQWMQEIYEGMLHVVTGDLEMHQQVEFVRTLIERAHEFFGR